ncbi:MAG: di-trans,poly-cis-decaprenylcistransferase [Polaromonas sp.]|nr:di-trans,poly-cis-decaprenylcistransferase [Polaromonas sp.]
MAEPLSSQGSIATPHHVAIVMDGNGRWAKKRFLPRVAGHKQGVEALRRTVKACLDAGIQVLSVFAFSSENWARPADEVSGLMELMALALSREVSGLHQQGVQIHFPGDKSRLSPRVTEGLEKAQALTAHNTRLVLNVCFNYGGRWDIVQAAAQVQAQGLPITEQNLAQHLALAHVPDPDLFIRTGGEMRVSNFLIWQMAYAEFYFSQALWPDFGPSELESALAAYQRRERRFGLTSEQINAATAPTPEENR